MTRRVLTRAQRQACVQIAAEANRLRGRAPRGAVLVVALDFEGCPFVQGPPVGPRVDTGGMRTVRVPARRGSLSVHAWEVAANVWPEVLAA